MEAFRAAAGIADPAPDANADATRDLELGGRDSRLNRNPSRASLPYSLAHRRSISTFGRSRPNSAAGGAVQNDGAAEQEEEETEGQEDEIPWGPEHPCFPHPNPHVPLSSPLYESTRIIRIRRDYMPHGDLAPAFSNIYPEILDPLVPEDRFRALIMKLNTTLASTFIPTTPRNILDTTMGLLTGWIWDDLGLTGTKRSLKALEAWIEDWNRDVGAPESVVVIPLRRTAYLCLDIQIPDPQISIVDGESTADGALTGTNGNASGRFSAASRPGSRTVRSPGSSARRQRHAGLSDDVTYGPYPVPPTPVPPIPDRFREERQTWGSANGVVASNERGGNAEGEV